MAHTTNMDSLLNFVARKNALEYQSPYGYTPSLAPGIAYLVVFSLLTLIHTGLAIKYKYWIVFVSLVPGGVLEIVGWAGRLWSHENVLNSNPFIMQICTLILGPAFFSAWAYATLGYCIQRLGSAYSVIGPKMYLAVFVTADIVSLVLQAIGGGQAAVQAIDGRDTTSSTHIMLAGILFQLGTMTIFVVLASDFIVRALAKRPYQRRIRKVGNPTSSDGNGTHTPAPDAPDTPPLPNSEKVLAPANSSSDLRKAKLLLAGVAFASLMIFVRGIYRSVELAQGWTGYVITHEPFFTWLDGFPMVLCYAVFVVAHPGWLLPPRRGWKNA